MTVEHVSIFSLGTAIEVHSSISGRPWQQGRLIVTVVCNWETIRLAGTWADRKWWKLLKQKLVVFSSCTYTHWYSPCLQYRRTSTCGDGDIYAGLAGAVLMAGLDIHCILLLTVELRHAAVTEGGVASMHIFVFTHSDNMIGFSNRRGAPRHQRTVFLAGSVNHHVRGWTGLCEERNTAGGCFQISTSWRGLHYFIAAVYYPST